MGVRGYGVGHICWAVNVEKSGLCTQDYLDKEATLKDKPYLRDEGFQADVERARHFVFDELPLLGGTEFKEKLIYHLRNFTSHDDEPEMAELYDEILRIVDNH